MLWRRKSMTPPTPPKKKNNKNKSEKNDTASSSTPSTSTTARPIPPPKLPRRHPCMYLVSWTGLVLVVVGMAMMWLQQPVNVDSWSTMKQTWIQPLQLHQESANRATTTLQTTTTEPESMTTKLVSQPQAQEQAREQPKEQEQEQAQEQPKQQAQEQAQEQPETTEETEASPISSSKEKEEKDEEAASPQCSIYMAPTSLKGVQGFGLYTTRDIPRTHSILQSHLPDAPSIPVLDYWPEEDEQDEEYDESAAFLQARLQFTGLFDNYWWARGKPDHVDVLTHGYSVDFQITFGSLPNHHCVLDGLEAYYPHTDSAQYAPYDDSYRLAPTPNTNSPMRGALSYSNGRNFTAIRDLQATEEIFLDYGHCDPHPPESTDDNDNAEAKWQDSIPNVDDFQQVTALVETVYQPWLIRQQTKEQEAAQQKESTDPITTSLDQKNKTLDDDHQEDAFPVVQASTALIQRLLPQSRTDLEHILGNGPRPKGPLLHRVARHLGTHVRSESWIREHGLCLEHLVAKPSTIPFAGRGAFAQHDLTQGQVIVPAPILHIVDQRALDMYNEDGERLPDTKQLLLNYCIGHAESSVLLCPNTNAILINHYQRQFPAYQELGLVPDLTDDDTNQKAAPNARFQWSSYDATSDEWRQLTMDELWDQGTQRGLFMEVVALRDIRRGEEVTVDYGPDWERAWNRHVVQTQGLRREMEHHEDEEEEDDEHEHAEPDKEKDNDDDDDELWKSSIQVANQQDVIALQSGDLRKQTWRSNDYLFTGCHYHMVDGWDNHPVFSEDVKDWEEFSDDQLLQNYSDDAREFTWYHGHRKKIRTVNGTEDFISPAYSYATHDDQSYWPCTVIESTDPQLYTVRIHPRHILPEGEEEYPAWAESGLPRYLRNFPRHAIHYLVKPQASDQHWPHAFRHWIGLPESNKDDDDQETKDRTTFPEQWKNWRSEQHP